MSDEFELAEAICAGHTDEDHRIDGGVHGGIDPYRPCSAAFVAASVSESTEEGQQQ